MEVLENRQLQIALVAYLDVSGCLKQLEKASLLYKQRVLNASTKYAPPFRYNLSLDFSLAADVAGDFAELLLREPHLAKELARLVVWTCLRVLNDWYDLPEDWICLQMTLDHVPNIPQLFERQPFKNRFPSGLFHLKALLLAVSTPYKFHESSVFKCSVTDCPGREVAVRRRQRKMCSHCGKPEAPVQSTSITCQAITAYFLPFRQCLSLDYPEVHQAVKVTLLGDVGTGIELGMTYLVCCVLGGNGQGCESVLSSWGLTPLLSEPLSRSIKSLPLPVLPPAVTEYLTCVREECDNSCWSVVTALACHLASAVYPFQSFLHLKTALLLSIASTASSCPVSVVALGDCCERLMLECASLLSCHDGSCASQAWCPTVHQLQLHMWSEDITIAAGPLLMAQRGICYIGNCPKINSQFMSYINTAVESEMVRIFWKNLDKGMDGDDIDHPNEQYGCKNALPLTTAVWTHWNFNGKSVQDFNQLRTLIKLFGVPFVGDLAGDDTIMSHLLNQAANHSVKSLPLTNNDIKQYLEIVCAQPVEMSENASTLIQNYFVTCRRHRAEQLPVKAIKILTSLCESHARLCLKSVAGYEDAVAVIYLYEESLLKLFGAQGGNIYPSENPPPMRDIVDLQFQNDPAFDIIETAKQVDCLLSRFSNWLDSYIETVTN